MLRRRAKSPLLLVIPLLLLAGAPNTPADPSREEREAELLRLRERIQALRSELDTDRSQYDGLRRELQAAERRVGELARTLKQLGDQLTHQKARLEELQGEQGRLERTVEAERELLARQIRAAYLAGRQEFVKILLNQEDPALVGRVMAYYDYLNRARAERISSFLTTLETLDAVRLAVVSERERLEGLQARQRGEMEALEQAQANRGATLIKLRRELSTKDQRLAALLQDEKELEAVVRVLTEAMDDIPVTAHRPFRELKGKMAWPSRGRLAVRYGTKHALGDFNWRGVLIEAKEGDEVRAISGGRVAFADWLRGYGLLLIIDHGDGFMSLYAHNRSLLKEAGDWIAPGEAIAQVGQSGGQDNSGLYFEIRKDGEPVDPSAWCRNIN